MKSSKSERKMQKIWSKLKPRRRKITSGKEMQDEGSLPAIGSLNASYSTSLTLPSSYLLLPPVARKAVSDVRRTFCLFVTFDLLFITLLWIIELNVPGPILDNLADQVIRYKFKSSFFDIVLLAVFRFLCLQIGYAAFLLKHWWVVAISTLVTSVFLVVKVIVSELLSKNAFGYVLPITSFVVAWLETWFLDFKVLTQEAENDRAYVAAANADRGPMLYPRPFSDGQFYSPPESIADSEEFLDEDGLRSRPATSQEKEYIKQGQDAMTVMENILAQEEHWKLEKTSETGDSVYSLETISYGKIFILKAFMQCPAEFVYQETILQPEKVPEWTRTVTSCKILQRIDDNTMVTHDIAGSVGGGIVASRDYVTVRRIERRQNSYFSTGVSTNHDARPPTDRYVRGENRPGGFVVLKCISNPAVCTLIWILNTDFKGHLPRYLIHQALPTGMFDYVGQLRERIADVNPYLRQQLVPTTGLLF
ncbi:stAR-related lipid transfer protein 3 isoform X2 [Poecilia reticulata]|uniref:StAR related lipid transfer domain containing 3 n=2 Tax=Poecilia reticulata TaxID=8081 RepID=A0A3P9P3A2_POERE|nr:PREDICTED: stAR-related lipid transfer protein 3 isoform X2 [Poecilia reticulata]